MKKKNLIEENNTSTNIKDILIIPGIKRENFKKRSIHFKIKS